MAISFFIIFDLNHDDKHPSGEQIIELKTGDCTGKKRADGNVERTM